MKKHVPQIIILLDAGEVTTFFLTFLFLFTNKNDMKAISRKNKKKIKTLNIK